MQLLLRPRTKLTVHESHRANFQYDADCHRLDRDITAISPDDLAKALGPRPTWATFDIRLGTPCQVFARAGGSELQEVSEHPEVSVTFRALKRRLRSIVRWKYPRS